MDTTGAAVDPLIGGREVEPANPDSTRFYKEMLGYLLGDQLHRHVRSTIVISRRDFHNLADLQKVADCIENRHRVILERFSPWGGHTVETQLRTHASSRGLQSETARNHGMDPLAMHHSREARPVSRFRGLDKAFSQR